MQPIDITANPELVQRRHGVATAQVFGFLYSYVDKDFDNIRFTSSSEMIVKAKPMKKKYSDKGIGVNSINMQFNYRKLTYKHSILFWADIIERLGGILYLIWVVLGQLFMLLVVVYMIDIVGLIRRNYSKIFKRNVIEQCLENVHKL